jgi:hypothetical protein
MLVLPTLLPNSKNKKPEKNYIALYNFLVSMVMIVKIKVDSTFLRKR